MDYETALKTCSAEVQAAIKWLEEQVRFDRKRLENELEEIEKLKRKEKKTMEENLKLINSGCNKRKLKTKYLCSDAFWFYVLSKVNPPILKDFLDASKNKEFWLDEEGFKGFDDTLYEEPYLLW